MEKDKKEVKKAPAVKPAKEKKEIPDKELNKASGGIHPARDGRFH